MDRRWFLKLLAGTPFVTKVFPALAVTLKPLEGVKGAVGVGPYLEGVTGCQGLTGIKGYTGITGYTLASYAWTGIEGCTGTPCVHPRGYWCCHGFGPTKA